MNWWQWVLTIFGVIVIFSFIAACWDNITDFIKKPRSNKARLNNELRKLSSIEQTLGAVDSLESGIHNIIKQFELTSYVLTSINIYLSKYIKESDPLQIQVVALRELYDEFLDKSLQEKLDLINYTEETEQNGKTPGTLLVSNMQFLRNYNKLLNYRIQSIKTAVNNILVTKHKGRQSITKKFKYSSLLNKDEQLAYSINSELYAIIFTFENLLRNFIYRVAKENSTVNIKDWFNKEALDTLAKVKKEESDNKWTPRGTNELYYIELKNLKDIICNHWKIFDKYFKRQDAFKSKMDLIYGVRCKIAHNSMSISENEITLCKIYIDELITPIK